MIMTMMCVLCVYWISACVRVAVHSVCPHIGWQQMIWCALHIWGNSNSHTHTHTVSLSLSLSPSSVIYIYSVPTRVCVTFHHTLHRLLSYTLLFTNYHHGLLHWQYRHGNDNISCHTLPPSSRTHTPYTTHLLLHGMWCRTRIIHIYIIVVLSIQHIWTIDRA